MKEREYLAQWATFVILLLAVLSLPAAGGIIYVDDDATAGSDGSSWADAYNTLQDAFADANTAEKPVEIRVAQGIYTPDKGAGITRGDHGVTFRLINGVTIKGGFAGITGIDPDARDVEAYPTVLSGDLNDDDAKGIDPDDLFEEPTRAENSYTVVTGSDTNETAVLDGVVVTAARQSDVESDDGSPVLIGCLFTSSRRGMGNFEGDPSLTNCTFTGLSLAALSQWGGTITLTNCLFTGNPHGSIESHPISEMTLNRCTFQDNRGSAINCMSGSLTLTGCLFRNNTGTSGVGISGRGGGDIMLHDCIFEGNIASGWGGAINCSGGSNLALYNCTFRANAANQGGALYTLVTGPFLMERCVFAGNIGGAIEIHSSEPTVVSGCVFAGNRGSAIETHGSYLTVRNCTFHGNAATDGVSVLNAPYEPRVTNCIFWANSAPVIESPHGELPSVSYCNVEGEWGGIGNIDADPCFVEPGYWDTNGTPDDENDDFWVDGDYHLRSEGGRWSPTSQAWVRDDLTSPCIDTGDPNSPIATEPFPNGGRINMGAYGGTEKASKSYFGKPPCETVIAGDINGDCVVDFDDLAILVSHWMMRGEDFVNKPPTVRMLNPRDGDRIAWPGPTLLRAEAEDVDGEIRQVSFNLQYRNGDEVTTHGFSATKGVDGWEREYSWPNNLGSWTIWAEAKDNEGVTSVSPEITITLYRP